MAGDIEHSRAVSIRAGSNHDSWSRGDKRAYLVLPALRMSTIAAAGAVSRPQSDDGPAADRRPAECDGTTMIAGDGESGDPGRKSVFIAGDQINDSSETECNKGRVLCDHARQYLIVRNVKQL